MLKLLSTHAITLMYRYITCIAGAAILLLATGTDSIAQSEALSVDAGMIKVKNPADTSWTTVTISYPLQSGDSVKLSQTVEAVCSLPDSISLYLKDSTLFTLSSTAGTRSLELVKGQLFLKKSSKKLNTLQITAKGATFSPLGTAAAFKIIRNGSPSVAVVQGAIRITAPNGSTQQVNAGNYSTYDIISGTITPVAQLTEAALASLQNWTNVKLDTTSTPQETPPHEPPPAAPVVTPPSPPVVTTQQPPAPPAVQPSPPTAQTTTPTAQTSPTPPSSVPSPQPAPSQPQPDTPSQGETAAAAPDEGKPAPSQPGQPQKTEWEVGTGIVTVDKEQWTRVAISCDIPIWRFGIGLDIELFLDSKGGLTNKGWNFDSYSDAGESMLRKIRYLRFNYPQDPFYSRVGGLDDVTLGYGFLVSHFANTLHYPGEKLYGLHMNINDVTMIGITTQIMIADFLDFEHDGGVIAGRLALRPLKSLSMPIISSLSFGASIALDINQYAPARTWDYSLFGDIRDRDEDGKTDSTYLYAFYHGTSFYDSLVAYHKRMQDYDTDVEHKDAWASRKNDRIMLLGADVSLPLLKSGIVSIDLYGQAGITVNDDNDASLSKGWGIGVPGVSLKAGPFWAQAEYRHVQDCFLPGYFNRYYLDERIVRNPVIMTKEQTLDSVNLNGVFASAGCMLGGIIILEGNGQILIGAEDSQGRQHKDQRVEGSASVGPNILKYIPKPSITKAEIFYHQSEISGNLFDKSPHTYWGYRAGIEPVPNSVLLWETRFGWQYDKNGT
ncbi:MAG: FecR domain-containing protein, partial [Chitinivibrionales bacterium]|nr:FecR domain-containing protein [Chitinivibrionales bacterium]